MHQVYPAITKHASQPVGAAHGRDLLWGASAWGRGHGSAYVRADDGG
ncbi:hypothetical protein [Acidithiobacillus sp.]